MPSRTLKHAAKGEELVAKDFVPSSTYEETDSEPEQSAAAVADAEDSDEVMKTDDADLIKFADDNEEDGSEDDTEEESSEEDEDEEEDTNDFTTARDVEDSDDEMETETRVFNNPAYESRDEEKSDDGEEEDGDLALGEIEEEIDLLSDTELELERAVFGDRAGFQDGLRTFDKDFTLGISGEEDEAGPGAGLEEDLGGVADADLFMVDTGDASAAKAFTRTEQDEEETEQEEGDRSAWEDSDDERILMSLATVPRLRKLRRTEAEDVVNGKEYRRRLMTQFERLNPPPHWVQDATLRNKRKHASGSQEEDEDGMDLDEDISAQPLAKLLRDSSALSRWQETTSNKRRKLQPGQLAIARLKDVDGEQPSAVDSLCFHPSYPLLLSSGLAKTVWLHHLHPYPPKPNPLLTSLHIRGEPVHTSAFHPSPSDPRIFLSSKRRHFHVWNLLTGRIQRISRLQGHDATQGTMENLSVSPNGGKYIALKGHITKNAGVINILNGMTFQHIACARVESRIAAFTWWADGEGLCIAGTSGEVYEWSIAAQRTVAIWQDEGGLNTTTVALGGRSGHDNFLGGDRWVAIGGKSGIVNIYDRRSWLTQAQLSSKAITNGLHPSQQSSASQLESCVPSHPTPLRSVDNLLTPISTLCFSPDGQILCLASRSKRDSLRLVHLPSATVYQNWPTQQTPLGRVTSVAWGRGDILKEVEGEGVMAVLAVGNERGKIRIWEIR